MNRWLLVLLLIAIGCAVGTYRRDVLYVRVVSQNFDARRVRLFCHGSGAQLAVVRDLSNVRVASERVPLANCGSVRILVQAGRTDWLSEPIMVQRGDTLDVTVGVKLQYTSWFVR